MAVSKTKQFSEYELDEIGFIFDSTDKISETCIGSMTEEMESKTTTKKCRGVVTKSVTRGTGTGTLTISMHVKAYVANKLSGMYVDTLKDGITAYGENSIHPEFIMTGHVKDEDQNEKYKAYPKCVLASKPSVNIENGAEDIAEVEMTINVMPDAYRNGLYECFEEDLPSGITNWMTDFTSAAMQVSA